MSMANVRIKRAIDKLDQAERNLFHEVVEARADGMTLEQVAEMLGLGGGKNGASQWIRYRRNKYAEADKAGAVT